MPPPLELRFNTVCGMTAQPPKPPRSVERAFPTESAIMLWFGMFVTDGVFGGTMALFNFSSSSKIEQRYSHFFSSTSLAASSVSIVEIKAIVNDVGRTVESVEVERAGSWSMERNGGMALMPNWKRSGLVVEPKVGRSKRGDIADARVRPKREDGIEEEGRKLMVAQRRATMVASGLVRAFTWEKRRSRESAFKKPASTAGDISSIKRVS